MLSLLLTEQGTEQIAIGVLIIALLGFLFGVIYADLDNGD